MSSNPEPFPPFNGAATPRSSMAPSTTATSRRRRSSAFDGIPAGDTGAPSLATSLAHMNGNQLSKGDGNVGREKRFSKRRKARSVARRIKHFAVRHTWALPLALLVGFLSLYAVNPSETNPIHRFIFLSYRIEPAAGGDPAAPVQYGKGLWDLAFVSFYIIVLSFTREFIMQELLRPLALYCGLKNKGKQARFMEQMYTAVYFSFLGPAGMYVMSRTPVWYFNTAGFYEDMPHHTLDAAFKFYYLFQAAYWAQQAIVLVLGMEKPRKDYKELVGHHIVSIALIALSYRFHFCRIGLAVYVTHDISDFFLATSKSFNYIWPDSVFMAPYFFVFVCVWIYLRHYLNLRIIYSLFTEYQTIGPFELDWEGGQFKCRLGQIITSSLLSALQALNLFWLFYILRIAYRFVFAAPLEDDRSEYEETDVEDEDAAIANQLKTTAAATTATTTGSATTGSAAAANGSTKRR